MWSFIVILAAAVIVMIDVPRLLQNKQKKELWVFTFLLAAGVCLGIAKSLRTALPNPLDWISAVFGPVAGMFFGNQS